MYVDALEILFYEKNFSKTKRDSMHHLIDWWFYAISTIFQPYNGGIRDLTLI